MKRLVPAVLVWLGATPFAWSGDQREPTEITIDRNTQIGGRIGFGGPTGAGVTLRLLKGLGADVREGRTRVDAVCGLPMPQCANGFLLELTGGSGGGKLSLGLGARARVNEDDFNGTVGFGLKASLARTWGSPIGTERGLTYLGPELDLSILRAELTLGVLWRVDGAAGKGAMFSWGLGIGL
jgi:hypothetical protein